jgi:hypothetical protein
LVRLGGNSGRPKWVVTRPDYSIERITLDSTGEVLATGSREFRSEQYWGEECVTLKYGADGSQVWERSFLPASESLQAWGYYLTALGTDVVISGSYYPSFGPSGAPERGFVIRYSGDGSERWINAWTPGAGTVFMGQPVGDAAGDVYVDVRYVSDAATGSYPDSAGVLKLDEAGEVRWMTPVGIDGCRVSWLDVAGVDESGGPLVGAAAYDDEWQGRIVAGRLSASGELLSLGVWPGSTTGDFYDPRRFLAVDDGICALGDWLPGNRYPQHGFLLRLVP